MAHSHNIDAIDREKPILEKHTKRSIIQRALVQRWDINSINNYYPISIDYWKDNHYGPYYFKYGHTIGEPGAIAIEGRLHLLSREGETLYIVGENRKENIGQALHVMQEEKRRVCYGLERIYSPYYKGFFFKKLLWRVVPEVFTLYKLPKEINNAEEWVESIIDYSLDAIKDM